MRHLRLFMPALCATISVFSVNSFAGAYPPANAVQNFDFPDGTIDLADGTTIGSDQKTASGAPVAGIYSANLRISDKGTTNAVASFKLADLDPGNVIKSFDLRFNLTMSTPAGGQPSEGWSVNFGNLPADNGTGEGGFAPLPRGLTVAFNTLANADSPTSIEVLVGGVSITNVARSFLFDTGNRAVVLHWDPAGLDLSYENRPIVTDLALPGFSPGQGNTFGFTARSSTNGMDVLLDALKATTTALPVIEGGGPIISEFVANNGDLEDEFAEKPSWLEILNASSNTVDLANWYLTDSKQNLKKWRIDALSLTPYNYQVVFASGNDRQLSTNSFLHTSFSLARSGGYVALVRPDGTVSSSYEYGPQERGVSYGEKGAEHARGYMLPPSPGAVNVAEPAQFSVAPEVQYSHQGGFISDPITVSLSVPGNPAAQIRYTIDRTEPGPASLLFSNSITVTQLMVIRARAYVTNHLAGRVNSRMYVLMDATFTNYASTGKIFDSNIPLIYVDSFGVSVDGSTGGSRPYRPSYSFVVNTNATGRASLTNAPDYAGPSGIHVRGESSAGFDQRSYSLEIWDEANMDRDASLLGMPAESDWVLYGPWSEKTLMRNKLIFDWMIKMRGNDGMAVRTRFVELFFNQTKPATGRVGFSTYRGIYVLMEKLKVNSERLPLEKLNDKTVDPTLITGGYIIRKDKDDALKNNWTTPRFSIPLQSYDPDKMNTTQFNYIKSYMTAFETALNGTNFRNFTNGYRAYLDTESFIDAQWMVEISKQVDGYVFSTYFHKDRAGRLHAGPLWDFNIALGNADYGTGDTPTGWLYGTANGVGQLWWTRLHTDIDYKVAHWDRYWEMRRSIFATPTVMQAINTNMVLLLDGYTGGVSNRAPAEIQNPVARHLRKWPRLGTRDWPNPPAETTMKTWQQEVDYMKNWVSNRLNWIDDQTLRVGTNAFRPPVLSHVGGLVTEPIELTITPYYRSDRANGFPNGDVYYTLDNSDPRLTGGDISSSALKYTGAIPIQSSTTVKARMYVPGTKTWSALATGTYLFNVAPASASNLAISELMFRPALITSGETNTGLLDTQGFEFLELRNVSDNAVDLTGVKINEGVTFDFTYTPASTRLLKAGESVVLVPDKRAFMVRFPRVPASRIAGQYRGSLNNGGESLSIQAADGKVIKAFSFDEGTPWPATEASGRSIVLQNAASNPNPGEPSQWTLSAKPGGTPGQSGLGNDRFIGDAARDSDGDGESDLFEFATGSDPENPNSVLDPIARVAPIEVNGATDSYLTYQFVRNPEKQGIGLTIEMSNDLKNWNVGDLALVKSVENRDGTVTETYRTKVPVSQGATRTQFHRLKVQQQ